MFACIQRISSQCQPAISSLKKCDVRASISSALEVLSSKAQKYVPSRRKQLCFSLSLLAVSPGLGFLSYGKTALAAASAGTSLFGLYMAHKVIENDPTEILTAKERKSQRISSRGWKEYRTGDFASAYATFTQAEKANRINYYTVAGKGLCSLRLEKYEEALQCAAVLLVFSDTEKTRKSIAYYIIGETFYLQNKYQDAEEFFNLAIKRDASNILALTRKAEITQSPEDASKVIALKEKNILYVSPAEKEKCLEIANKILNPVSS